MFDRGRRPGMDGPRAMTPAATNALVALLAAGNYIGPACTLAGISRDTFCEWMNRGEKGIEPYKTFAKRINEALAAAESNAVKCITSAIADGNVDAAFKYLARRHPHRWHEDRLKLKQAQNAQAPANNVAVKVVLDSDDSGVNKEE